MDFLTFQTQNVSELISERPPMGLAIPFNGTRRWYLSTFQATPDALMSSDYLIQVNRRMREIMGGMFADGVHTIYTPALGRSLIERGEAYMRFSMAAMTSPADEEGLAWCAENRVALRYYGELTLLPDDIQAQLADIEAATHGPHVKHIVQYGVFADRPTHDIIQRVVRLSQDSATLTEQDLIADYYGPAAPPVDLWIGSDQPTVFDVPLVMHENTSLYFLQYPTLFLTHQAWRRILYDMLFVRGDQETLYAENLSPERGIMGLGKRQDGYWVPSVE